MTTDTKVDIYGIGFGSAKDLKRASQLLAQAYMKVEALFGLKQAKEVRMMRSDRSLR